MLLKVLSCHILSQVSLHSTTVFKSIYVTIAQAYSEDNLNLIEIQMQTANVLHCVVFGKSFSAGIIARKLHRYNTILFCLIHKCSIESITINAVIGHFKVDFRIRNGLEYNVFGIFQAYFILYQAYSFAQKIVIGLIVWVMLCAHC